MTNIKLKDLKIDFDEIVKINIQKNILYVKKYLSILDKEQLLADLIGSTFYDDVGLVNRELVERNYNYLICKYYITNLTLPQKKIDKKREDDVDLIYDYLKYFNIIDKIRQSVSDLKLLDSLVEDRIKIFESKFVIENDINYQQAKMMKNFNKVMDGMDAKEIEKMLPKLKEITQSIDNSASILKNNNIMKK
jgi:hypothetical protein